MSETITNKILALLAKAESTTFPEEAEALIAGAQKLMAKHAIDQAMLDAAKGTNDEDVSYEAIRIETPYALAKMHLLNNIAIVNDCRVIRMHKGKNFHLARLYGFPGDIEHVEQLFTALLMHSTRELLKLPTPAEESTKGFRNGFLMGFAYRIAERLEEAKAEAVVEAQEATSSSVALVLLERKALVEKKFDLDFSSGSTQTTTSTWSSAAGTEAGMAAADRADIGGQRLGSERLSGSLSA